MSGPDLRGNFSNLARLGDALYAKVPESLFCDRGGLSSPDIKEGSWGDEKERSAVGFDSSSIVACEQGAVAKLFPFLSFVALFVTFGRRTPCRVEPRET